MKRRLRAESLEDRRLLAADVFYLTNPLDGLDVNNDADVTPLDAMYLINALNSEADGGVATVNAFLDVTQDGILSPADPLSVINFLNAGGERAVDELRQTIDIDFNDGDDEVPGVPAPVQAIVDGANQLLARFDNDRQLLQQELDEVLQTVEVDPAAAMRQLERVEFASQMTGEVLEMSLDILDDDFDVPGDDPAGPGFEFFANYRDAVDQVSMDLDAGEAFETLWNNEIVEFATNPGDSENDLPAVFEGDYDRAIEVREFLASIEKALVEFDYELTPEEQEVLDRYVENPDQVHPEVDRLLCEIVDRVHLRDLTAMIGQNPGDVDFSSLIEVMRANADFSQDPFDPVEATRIIEWLNGIYTMLEQEGMEVTQELRDVVDQYIDQPDELQRRVDHLLCVMFDEAYVRFLAENPPPSETDFDFSRLVDVYDAGGPNLDAYYGYGHGDAYGPDPGAEG